MKNVALFTLVYFIYLGVHYAKHLLQKSLQKQCHCFQDLVYNRIRKRIVRFHIEQYLKNYMLCISE